MSRVAAFHPSECAQCAGERTGWNGATYRPLNQQRVSPAYPPVELAKGGNEKCPRVIRAGTLSDIMRCKHCGMPGIARNNQTPA